MAATKKTGSYDEVRIDGADASDLFREMNLEFADEEIDAPSFNAGGYVEKLLGSRSQVIVGEAYYTTELYALLYSMWDDKTIFEIGYQPNGLVDPTRETYVGNVRLTSWPVQSTFGQAQTVSLRFAAADNAGITAGAGS